MQRNHKSLLQEVGQITPEVGEGTYLSLCLKVFQAWNERPLFENEVGVKSRSLWNWVSSWGLEEMSQVEEICLDWDVKTTGGYLFSLLHNFHPLKVFWAQVDKLFRRDSMSSTGFQILIFLFKFQVVSMCSTLIAQKSAFLLGALFGSISGLGPNTHICPYGQFFFGGA